MKEHESNFKCRDVKFHSEGDDSVEAEDCKECEFCFWIVFSAVSVYKQSPQLGNVTQFHLIGFSHHPSPNKHLEERVSGFTYSTSLQWRSDMAVAFSKRSQKTEGDSARINILNDAWWKHIFLKTCFRRHTSSSAPRQQS